MLGNGAGEPARPLTSGWVQRPIVCASSALSRAWRAALDVGDDERVAAPCDTLYGAPRTFHKGEFDGREITVFEFHDMRDFTMVIAHELGHALGLGHVDDRTVIMHAVGGEQTIEPLGLAAADLAALKTACRRP